MRLVFCGEMHLMSAAQINNIMTKEEITHIILDKKIKREALTAEEQQVALQYFTQDYIDSLYMPNYGRPGRCNMRYMPGPSGPIIDARRFVIRL